jgi:8-oxo-dGTP diphosphatase
VSGEKSDPRLYPTRPILSASVAVFRDGRALVARRAKAPLEGLYSLPGGVVELGETLSAAAARELMEEVGVEARDYLFLEHLESIERDGDGEGVRRHFVIAVFAARWLRFEPRASLEAEAPLWVDPLALGDLRTTPGLAAILARAAYLDRSRP